MRGVKIIEENGEYYITTCGWLDKPLPHKGAVSIAKLVWEENSIWRAKVIFEK